MTETSELSPAQQAKLLSFLGFGNPLASAVFIGMEEGLEISPSLAEQLVVRSEFDSIMDLGEAARAHPGKYLSGSNPPIQPTWNLMIRILLALERNLEPTNDHVRFYQRDRLARRSEAGALLELMPLPCAKLSTWPYADLFPQYPSRSVYFDDLLHTRIGALREHLAYGPALVIAYGSAYWSDYRRIFPASTDWNRVGVFEFAEVGSTRVILTPHFTARTMNGQHRQLIDLALSAKGR